MRKWKCPECGSTCEWFSTAKSMAHLHRDMEIITRVPMYELDEFDEYVEAVREATKRDGDTECQRGCCLGSN